jgi:hypothetical protein
MNHDSPYYQDWQIGLSDGARTNPYRFPGARTGEALDAYNTGFDYGLDGMQDYENTTKGDGHDSQ